MRRIIYPGPGHILKAGGLVIPRGQPTEVSEQLFRRLQRDRSMTLVVVDPPKRRSAAPVPAPEPDPPADEAEVTTAIEGEEESD